MATRNLLYAKEYPIGTDIKIYIPTVGEVLEDEDSYYSVVSLLTAMPIDMMVQLDDLGIDFSAVSDYDVFILFFGALCNMDTEYIFGDLDLHGFSMARSDVDGSLSLIDTARDIKIDRTVYWAIADALRKIHHLKKDTRTPGNAASKEYMLERARKKQKREAKRQHDSQLESLIVAMVNTEQFKYNYEETLEMSIYRFNESVQQIVAKVDYDNRMHGVYAGTISAKDLKPEDLNWLTHK